MKIRRGIYFTYIPCLIFGVYFDEWIRKLIVYFENNAEFNVQYGYKIQNLRLFNSINGTIYL